MLFPSLNCARIPLSSFKFEYPVGVGNEVGADNDLRPYKSTWRSATSSTCGRHLVYKRTHQSALVVQAVRARPRRGSPRPASPRCRREGCSACLPRAGSSPASVWGARRTSECGTWAQYHADPVIVIRDCEENLPFRCAMCSSHCDCTRMNRRT